MEVSTLINRSSNRAVAQRRPVKPHHRRVPMPRMRRFVSLSFVSMAVIMGVYGSPTHAVTTQPQQNIQVSANVPEQPLLLASQLDEIQKAGRQVAAAIKTRLPALMHLSAVTADKPHPTPRASVDFAKLSKMGHMAETKVFDLLKANLALQAALPSKPSHQPVAQSRSKPRPETSRRIVQKVRQFASLGRQFAKRSQGIWQRGTDATWAFAEDRLRQQHPQAAQQLAPQKRVQQRLTRQQLKPIDKFQRLHKEHAATIEEQLAATKAELRQQKRLVAAVRLQMRHQQEMAKQRQADLAKIKALGVAQKLANARRQELRVTTQPPARPVHLSSVAVRQFAQANTQLDPDAMDSFQDLDEMQPLAELAPPTPTPTERRQANPNTRTRMQPPKAKRAQKPRHRTVVKRLTSTSVHVKREPRQQPNVFYRNSYQRHRVKHAATFVKRAGARPKTAVTSSQALAVKPARYTIQIACVDNPAILTKLIAAYGITKSKTIVQQRRGKPLYVLTYGNFRSRQVASNRLKSLPSKVQALRPWVRDLREIQR